MSRRDVNGPIGAGSMTGRGLGTCSGANAVNSGANLGMRLGHRFTCRRGLCRSVGRGFLQKELLHEQKSRLQEQLEVIDKQLENL